MKKWIRENRWLLYPEVLGFTCLLFFVSNLAWLNVDKTLHFASGGTHLLIAVNQLANLKTLDFRTFVLVREMYPNLYHDMVAVLGLGPWGLETAGALVNLFSVVAMCAGAYLLGKTLWGAEAGLLSGLMVMAFPGVREFVLVENVDLMAGVFVVFALWALVKSRKLEDPKWSAVFFILSALGMLSKWAFAFFLLIPFLMAAGPGLWKQLKNHDTRKNALIVILSGIAFYPVMLIVTSLLGPDTSGGLPFDSFFVFYLFLTAALIWGFWYYERKSRQEPILKNLARGGFIFFILTNHYYLFNIRSLIITYLGRFWMGRAKHAAQLTFTHFWGDLFIGRFAGIHLFLFILAGLLVYVIYRKGQSFSRNLSVGCAISGMVILGLQPVYIVRYFLPLSGVLSLLAVYWIFLIPWRWVQAVIVLPLVITGFFTWGGWAVLPRPIKTIPPGIAIMRPETDGWKIRELAREVYLHRKGAFSETEGIMVIFYNDADPARVPPLVFTYMLKGMMGPDQEIFLLHPRGGLSGEDRPDKPRVFVYYMNPAPGDDQDEPESNLEVEGDTVHPAAIYFVRIRKFTTPPAITPAMADAGRQIALRERKIRKPARVVRTIPLSRNTVADFYLLPLR